MAENIREELEDLGVSVKDTLTEADVEHCRDTVTHGADNYAFHYASPSDPGHSITISLSQGLVDSGDGNVEALKGILVTETDGGDEKVLYNDGGLELDEAEFKTIPDMLSYIGDGFQDGFFDKDRYDIVNGAGRVEASPGVLLEQLEKISEIPDLLEKYSSLLDVGIAPPELIVRGEELGVDLETLRGSDKGAWVFLGHDMSGATGNFHTFEISSPEDLKQAFEGKYINYVAPDGEQSRVRLDDIESMRVTQFYSPTVGEESSSMIAEVADASDNKHHLAMEAVYFADVKTKDPDMGDPRLVFVGSEQGYIVQPRAFDAHSETTLSTICDNPKEEGKYHRGGQLLGYWSPIDRTAVGGPDQFPWIRDKEDTQAVKNSIQVDYPFKHRVELTFDRLKESAALRAPDVSEQVKRASGARTDIRRALSTLCTVREYLGAQACEAFNDVKESAYSFNVANVEYHNTDLGSTEKAQAKEKLDASRQELRGAVQKYGKTLKETRILEIDKVTSQAFGQYYNIHVPEVKGEAYFDGLLARSTNGDGKIDYRELYDNMVQDAFADHGRSGITQDMRLSIGKDMEPGEAAGLTDFINGKAEEIRDKYNESAGDGVLKLHTAEDEGGSGLTILYDERGFVPPVYEEEFGGNWEKDPIQASLRYDSREDLQSEESGHPMVTYTDGVPDEEQAAFYADRNSDDSLDKFLFGPGGKESAEPSAIRSAAIGKEAGNIFTRNILRDDFFGTGEPVSAETAANIYTYLVEHPDDMRSMGEIASEVKAMDAIERMDRDSADDAPVDEEKEPGGGTGSVDPVEDAAAPDNAGGREGFNGDKAAIHPFAQIDEKKEIRISADKMKELKEESLQEARERLGARAGDDKIESLANDILKDKTVDLQGKLDNIAKDIISLRGYMRQSADGVPFQMLSKHHTYQLCKMEHDFAAAKAITMGAEVGADSFIKKDVSKMERLTDLMAYRNSNVFLSAAIPVINKDRDYPGMSDITHRQDGAEMGEYSNYRRFLGGYEKAAVAISRVVAPVTGRINSLYNINAYPEKDAKQGSVEKVETPHAPVTKEDIREMTGKVLDGSLEAVDLEDSIIHAIADKDISRSDAQEAVTDSIREYIDTTPGYRDISDRIRDIADSVPGPRHGSATARGQIANTLEKLGYYSAADILRINPWDTVDKEETQDTAEADDTENPDSGTEKDSAADPDTGQGAEQDKAEKDPATGGREKADDENPDRASADTAKDDVEGPGTDGGTESPDAGSTEKDGSPPDRGTEQGSTDEDAVTGDDESPDWAADDTDSPDYMEVEEPQETGTNSEEAPLETNPDGFPNEEPAPENRAAFTEEDLEKIKEGVAGGAEIHDPDARAAVEEENRAAAKGRIGGTSDEEMKRDVYMDESDPRFYEFIDEEDAEIQEDPQPSPNGDAPEGSQAAPGEPGVESQGVEMEPGMDAQKMPGTDKQKEEADVKITAAASAEAMPARPQEDTVEDNAQGTSRDEGEVSRTEWEQDNLSDAIKDFIMNDDIAIDDTVTDMIRDAVEQNADVDFAQTITDAVMDCIAEEGADKAGIASSAAEVIDAAFDIIAEQKETEFKGGILNKLQGATQDAGFVEDINRGFQVDTDFDDELDAPSFNPEDSYPDIQNAILDVAYDASRFIESVDILTDMVINKSGIDIPDGLQDVVYDDFNYALTLDALDGNIPNTAEGASEAYLADLEQSLNGIIQADTLNADAVYEATGIDLDSLQSLSDYQMLNDALNSLESFEDLKSDGTDKGMEGEDVDSPTDDGQTKPRNDTDGSSGDSSTKD